MNNRQTSSTQSDVMSLNNLACCCQNQGKYKKAKSLFIKALKKGKQIFGGDHPELATTLNNLACLYKSRSKYDKAKSFFLEALEIL